MMFGLLLIILDMLPVLEIGKQLEAEEQAERDAQEAEQTTTEPVVGD